MAWFAPVVGSVVAVLAWAGVAHSSGSGWVQAVGALLAAVLLIGLVAPVVPARRAAVTCTGSPVGRRGRAAGGADHDGQRAGPRSGPGYPTGPGAPGRPGPARGARHGRR